MSGKIVNFYNRKDFALSSWRINNQQKPDNGCGALTCGIHAKNFLGGRYVYRKKKDRALFRAQIARRYRDRYDYVVNDQHEMLAFVSRSHTLAVGAEGRTNGPIDEKMNLHRKLGFGDAPTDHSAQINWAIQDVHKYYSRLLESVGLVYGK